MTAAMVVFAPLAQAEEASLAQAVEMDSLTGAAGAYLDQYLKVEEVTGNSFAAGVEAVVEGSLGELGGIFRRGVKSGLLLLGISMLCALAGAVKEELGGGGLDPPRLAGTAAVAVVAAADVHTLMGLGSQVLKDMDAFSKLLLPTVTAVCAASGAPAAAVTRQGAVLLFLGLLLTVADKLILPLVYAYVAAQTAGAALGNEGLKRLGGLIKWVAAGLLSLLLTGFVLYLAVTGAVAGNADMVAQKAAKTAISGMIPVVGGILSDAAEAVVAGAGILKGTVGVIGLLTVLAICLVPFLRLGIHYLIYKCAAALGSTVAPGPVTGLIDSIGSAFALIMGMVGGGGMILYVALITSIKAVVG